MTTTSWSPDTSAVAAELKRFIAEKCAQVRAESRAAGHPMSPESSSLFAAAEQRNWPGVWDALAAMHKAMREGTSRTANWAVYPVEWAAVNEIGAALEFFASAEEKYAVAFARDIINSISPGSIYFGGTDPGRFLVTALSRSHVNGDPFFTLTQNALIDRRSYLRYVRGMYGSRIYIPTEEDVARAFNEYQEDARRRQSEGKLLPGETFEEVEGKLEIRGQISVMAINGLLTKLMFEKNQERDFFIEESFPLNWMYPHLLPHGLILKINREALPELSSHIVQRDHEYWTRHIGPMVGGVFHSGTALAEVVAFVEKVYLNHELSGVAGDPAYLEDELTQRAFSKLRSSIGGMYAWRAQNSKSTDEKKRMAKEAEFAFRQAFVLCPSSPGAVFRYMNLLIPQKRWDDAILLTEAALRLEEKARAPKMLSQLGSLLEQLRRMKQKQAK